MLYEKRIGFEVKSKSIPVIDKPLGYALFIGAGIFPDYHLWRWSEVITIW